MPFYKVVFLWALVGLVGCTPSNLNSPTPLPVETLQALWQSPSGIPQFINSVTRTYGQNSSGQGICVSINESVIWESGDFESDVYNNIQHSATVTIDGNTINSLQFLQLTAGINRYVDGRLVGSHNVATEICFVPPHLIRGLHLAEISLRSTSGVTYSYSWVFEVL